MKVLVIDYELDNNRTLEKSLEHNGFKVLLSILWPKLKC